MTAKIKILSPQLLSQIAAGEVIERPASVIKELVENAIDSGATRIEVHVEKGGMRLIRVRDNGCGISKVDLPLALMPHATSKLEKWQDLSNMLTLGFRGEALASISAISRTTLTSAEENQPAYLARAEGRHLAVEILPASHPKGTTVEVADLFFNIPARRKFLRGEQTEFLHIHDIMQRLVLSHFEIEWIFSHNEKTIWHLPLTTTIEEKEKRLAKIMGKAFVENAHRIEVNGSVMQVSGWIASSDYHRNQSDQQMVYVNRRALKDRILMHALRQAYADCIPAGRYPGFILYLQINPAEVDVNVHPAKHEVRFSNQRLIHDFLLSAIREIINPGLKNYEISLPEKNSFHVACGSSLSRGIKKQLQEENTESSRRFIGVFRKKYVLFEENNALKMFDAEAYYAKKIRAEYERQLENNEIPIQKLAVPIGIDVNQNQKDRDSWIEYLSLIGFELQRVSEMRVMIRGIPSVLREADIYFMLNKFWLNAEELSLSSLFAGFCLNAPIGESLFFGMKNPDFEFVTLNVELVE